MRFIKVMTGIVLVTIPLLMLAIPARLLKLSIAEKIPCYFHKFVLFSFGIKVNIIGTRKPNVPLILVANHLSWLDIMAIGASFPCYFVAKSDIASWPVLGFLAKVQNTIFVNRKAKGAEIGTQVDALSEALKNNKVIILFPEGTTSDGNRILPFKSALLAAAKEHNAYIQVLCLKYNYIAGMPTLRRERPFLAWYGDMGLMAHVKGILGLSSVNIQLEFGEYLQYAQFDTRQKLAKYLENSMRTTYTLQYNAS